MTAMLEIKNLHANAGDTLILKGIDLIIQPGVVLSVLGR
jgi:Fe-S cluster assembly ATPase SufC